MRHLLYIPITLGILLIFLPGLLGSPRMEEAIPFDPGRAMALTATIVGDGTPRVPGTRSHERARREIRQNLGGWEVREEEFFHGGRRYVNVIAESPGEAGETIYLGAHYDTRPHTPGAVDNASGVGVLLEAARSLAGRTWRRKIILGFWDGEEYGLLGSRAHLEGIDREAVLASIHLDMPGWRDGSAVIHTFRTGWHLDAERLCPAWLPALLLEAADRPLSIGDPLIPLHYQIGIRSIHIPFASDDGPFTEAGIPSVFLSNSSFTSFFPQYHGPGDDMSMIGKEALEDCGRILCAGVQRLMEASPGEDTSDSYLIILGRPLSGPMLTGLAIASLLPLLGCLRRSWPLIILGIPAGIFPGHPQLMGIVIPLALLFPHLERKRVLPLWGISLVGLLPGLSVFFFLLLVRMRFGEAAPLLIPVPVWAAMAMPPLYFLIEAVRMERRIRQ